MSSDHKDKHLADYDSPHSDLGASVPDIQKNTQSMVNFPSSTSNKNGRNGDIHRKRMINSSPPDSNYDVNTEPRDFRKPAGSYDPTSSNRYLVSNYPSQGAE